MNLDRARISRLLDSARHRQRGVLLESEGMELLEALGVNVPRRVELRGAADAARLEGPPFPGERAVLKVLAPHLLHKTEAQAVAVVPNRREAIAEGLGVLEQRFAGQPVDGYLVCEFVPHEPSLGHELLVGLRWTGDFGPVVTVGAGGIHTEFLAAAFGPAQGLATLSPALAGDDVVERALAALPVVRLITEGRRGRPPMAHLEELAGVVRRFLALAEAFCPDPVAEFEVNPLVLSEGRFVALDALLKFGAPPPAASAERPLRKLRQLLEPRTAAVMGVSEKLNPGRVILQNLLRDGFERERITVVKPGLESIEGCRCVPDLASLPGRVDLLILSIAAAQAPEVLTAVVEGERAESVILIPGGLGEKAGTEGLVARMQDAVARSRATAWGGPVINGGNCLGIRSVPGRYNTFFVPQYKTPVPHGESSPVAFISGSGAFVVSKGSKLARVNPRYAISIGNQMDVTIGDYVRYLRDDPAVEVFAVYAEGFRPLDGLRFLEAARTVVASGRTVILYRAGRTGAGAAAAASHTAAIAGDYAVTRQLAAGAGVIVAETLDDFEDLVRLFAYLRGRPAEGTRLGALSNAGFECVAIADNLGELRLADYGAATVAALQGILERARLSEIVTVRNPIDLSPILGDADYEQVARLVLEDPGVDLGLVGCVPMTGALNTLPPGPGHREDLAREDSIVSRLARLRAEIRKPWVVVVDAGSLYDVMAQRLEEAGIPTFRTADRGLRLLNVWSREMRRRAAAQPEPVAAPGRG
jgi:acyl-CoA synthetase (NDP forming)